MLAGSVINTEGSGTLNLDGGALNIAGNFGVDNLNLGNAAGSSGSYTVTSGKSINTASFLRVGVEGEGQLIVDAGGAITTNALFVRNVNSSVDAAGSILVNAGMIVSNGGAATSRQVFVDANDPASINDGAIWARGGLAVADNARFDTIDAYVGYRSSGQATVSFGGVLATSGKTYVADGASTGRLSIFSGGKVETGTDAYVARNAGADGEVLIDGAGSAWNVGGSLFVGGDETTAGGAGNFLTVRNNSSLTVGGTLKVWTGNGLFVESGATVEANVIDNSVGIFNLDGGTLLADEFIGDLQITAGSTVSPGHSPGLLSVSGDYTQNALGTLLIEIDGLIAATEYDVLDVAGTASLDGTLQIDLGFNAQLGDSFDILMAETIEGQFSSIEMLGTLSEGLRWVIDYDLDLGGQDIVSLQVAAVPVPAAVWLFGSALAGLGWMRRKRVSTVH